MAFPNIGKKTQGKDYNFFGKVVVNWATFGGGSPSNNNADIFITFPTQGAIFHTEGSSTNTVEYSFNGNTVHGELVPGTNRTTLTFNNRKICEIWFRVKSGSSGPITVSVEAWSQS